MAQFNTIAAAVDSAMEQYQLGAALNPLQFAEARRDFERFYAFVKTLGLVGIRWNFDGCILCTRPEGVYPAYRILLTHPTVVEAAQGRALGTLACFEHVNAGEVRLVDGALRRIREAPPR